MRFFKFRTGSNEYAGFDSNGIIAIDGDKTDIDYSEIDEIMYDYISGYVDEDDDEDVSAYVTVTEIDEEEYNKELSGYFSGSLIHTTNKQKVHLLI